MHASQSNAENLQQYINIIGKQADCWDQKWRERQRKIDTRVLSDFIFRCLLSKESQGYTTTLNQMWLSDREHNSDKPLAASSVCEARQKLEPEVFLKMNTALIKQFDERPEWEDDLWSGLKLYAIDGSTVWLPSPLKKDGYKIQKNSETLSQCKLSLCYRLKSGLVEQVHISKKIEEKSGALDFISHLSPGDVVVVDRNYFSKEFLSKLLNLRLNGIFRMRYLDKLIKPFFKGKASEKEITLNNVKLRFIKYKIKGGTYVIATTLLDREKYSVEMIKEAYHARWGVEEAFKNIKRNLHLQDFHSKTERGVLQEIYASIVLSTLARIIASSCQIPESKESPQKKASLKTLDSRVPQNGQILETFLRSSMLH